MQLIPSFILDNGKYNEIYSSEITLMTPFVDYTRLFNMNALSMAGISYYSMILIQTLNHKETT